MQNVGVAVKLCATVQWVLGYIASACQDSAAELQLWKHVIKHLTKRFAKHMANDVAKLAVP